MHRSLTDRRVLALVFAVVFISVLASSLYIHESRKEYLINTKLVIANQEKELSVLAQLTADDGADAVVSSIIKDCSPENRSRFDTLLGSLGNLKGAELIEVKQLFDACGNFYAERKAVMASRLSREYETYSELIDLLATADARSAGEYPRDAWGELIAKEEERSTLYTDLVSIQESIINELLAGHPVSAESLQTLLVKGQKTRDSLDTLAGEITALRQRLADV
jgi:hypothetical protein